jgi:hypothetical protein
MGLSNQFRDDTNASPLAGWTEYAIAFGVSPAGRCLAVQRRRLSSSVATYETTQSVGGVWSASEFEDIMARFEERVRAHLIVTRGLQLTLPFEG